MSRVERAQSGRGRQTDTDGLGGPRGQLREWPGVGRQAGTGPGRGLTLGRVGLRCPGRWWWSSLLPLGLWGAQ